MIQVTCSGEQWQLICGDMQPTERILASVKAAISVDGRFHWPSGNPVPKEVHSLPRWRPFGSIYIETRPTGQCT